FLADILDDRAAFENPHLAVAEAGDLVERLLLYVVGGALLAEQSTLVVEPGFLERPAGAQIANDALCELRHPAEGGDLDRRIRIDWHFFLLALECYAGVASATGCAPFSANSGSIHIGAHWWPSGSSKSRPYIGPPL